MLVEVKYNTKCCSRLWKELPVDEHYRIWRKSTPPTCWAYTMVV